jgi:hypothetical protein
MAATLPGVSTSAVDVSVTVALDRVPDVTTFLTLSGRVVGANDYAARLKILATGTVQLSIVRSGTALTTVTLPGTLAAGTRYHLRLLAQGTSPTTLRASAWADGAVAPSTWMSSTSDSTAALQASGSLKLLAYLSSGATNGPLTVSWDDLGATTPN